MTTNIALPFSGSVSGKPIIINTSISPGVLIHRSGNSLDFVWLWLTLNGYASYLDSVYVTILKGDITSGYVIDGAAYRITSNEKQPIEIGIPISNQCELRAYINASETSLEGIDVSATGYVHRRID
jgi:hypothetical protein